MQPYPEQGCATEHERWAEQEAAFCDKMVESLAESALTYTERAAKALTSGHPHSAYSYLSGKDAYEIGVRINVWQQMADQLRRPRIIRIESERQPA